MSGSGSLAQAKVEQSVGILDELGIDAWLTFARETTETGDPVLPLILGQPVTWQSAFIVTRSGERIAIVGKYEDEAVRSTGAWTQIIPYVEGVSGPLRDVLGRLDPASLAINYSEHDVKADGLTVGLHRLLLRYLEGTPYGGRLESAERIVTALRSRKTPIEVERMRAAIVTTDEIFAETAAFTQVGTSERAVSAFMHERAAERGLLTAWEADMCPIVTTGPDSMVGHGLPSADLSVTPGRVFHLDFGVVEEDYCSDIQRCWYVPRDGETAAPAAIADAFTAIVRAIDAAAAVLRPGVPGWEVDRAARESLVAAGYPEYQHATGHHVGRAAHDGGGVLGPKWERYGATPEYPVEAGNVVTLELGVDHPEAGYIGLEEMVHVTPDGLDWLSRRQVDLPLLGA